MVDTQFIRNRPTYIIRFVLLRLDKYKVLQLLHMYFKYTLNVVVIDITAKYYTRYVVSDKVAILTQQRSRAPQGARSK